MNNIVITGVSTGIGYGAAKGFIRKGYRVFGSIRNSQDANRLKEELGDNFIPLIFDITDHEAILKAASEVKRIAGSDGIAGLINNAGATEGGPLMHIPLETFRNNLEVLVTGQLAVTRAFLPLLGASAECRHKPGRIIMISSTSGKSGFPFLGPYVAAKHALEGLSKSLRAELMIYGIKLVVIGPGNIKTPIWSKNKIETIERYNKTDYYTALWNMHEYLEKNAPAESMEPEYFCDKLIGIFEKKNPKARYTIVKNPIKHWLITFAAGEKLKNRIVAGILKMQIFK